MIAGIAEKKKFSDRSDHMKIIFIFMIAMIAELFFFSAIAAIIRKPGFNLL